jgi:hypothetical protein
LKTLASLLKQRRRELLEWGRHIRIVVDDRDASPAIGVGIELRRGGMGFKCCPDHCGVDIVPVDSVHPAVIGL